MPDLYPQGDEMKEGRREGGMEGRRKERKEKERKKKEGRR